MGLFLLPTIETLSPFCPQFEETSSNALSCPRIPRLTRKSFLQRTV